MSSLALYELQTPRFPVPRYDTGGTYLQVRSDRFDLRAVNAALLAAVVDDQRAYEPYARREKPLVAYKENGVYRTSVDRRYVSASSVVVSALMPLTQEVFPGQHGGDGWLATTVRVPSGRRVTITSLFTNPREGLRALATAARERIRRTEGSFCLHGYPGDYTATAKNFREFALTQHGIAIGFWEDEACYRLAVNVPYDAMRRYFSKLGMTLVAGVRAPR